MEDAWWEGYETGMSGEGSNPYPLGFRRGMWEVGRSFGCHTLANILESIMMREDGLPIEET